jgi:hypothetical protein
MQGLRDTLQNATKIFQHIIVPETQDTKALCPQPCIAFRIIRRFGRSVLPTIDLNDEPCFEADKIHNIRTNRKLSPKRQTLKAMRSQPLPDFRLRIGHAAPKCTRP